MLWQGDDEPALGRVRKWAQISERPRGLLPRRGEQALRPAGRSRHAWLAEGRVAQRSDLVAPESLFPDGGTAYLPPAVVVAGTLTFDVPLHDELDAVRAAIRHLKSKSKPIADALSANEDVVADPLTPVAVLRTAIAELLAAAQQAGLSGDGVRRSARATLIRSRRYAELDVLGEPHVVARWSSRLGVTPWVIYIPKTAVTTLPIEASFGIRAAVTVHPRQDPEERGAHALRVHALARVHAAETLVEETGPASQPQSAKVTR